MAFPNITPTPTNFYPRIRYGTSPIITIDLRYPVETIIPGPGGVIERTVSRSGAQETLWMRNEWAANFVMQLLDSGELARLKTFFDNHGVRGNQFQLWIDRFTGPNFLFGDNVRDHNKTSATLSGTETYTGYTNASNVDRYGLSFTSGNSLLHSVTEDVDLKALEGIVTVRFRPDWAATDNLEHDIITIGSSASSTNVIRIYKSASNELRMEVKNNAGAQKSKCISATWSANTEQEIVGRWNDGVLGIWLNGVAGTVDSGVGDGKVTTLGSTLYIGSDNGATPGLKATGIYDHVGTYMKAFTNAVTLVDKPVETRTYYSRAELQEVQFLPVRMVGERQLSRISWTVRQGEA